MSDRRPNRSEYYWVDTTPFRTPPPVKSRPDETMAAIVEMGIMINTTSGLKPATEFLEKKNVPFHVAKRVLLHPSQRRKPKLPPRP